MSITFQVLGAPGRDNALFVRVESGQASQRLLFDCGEGCPSDLPVAELHAVDQLLFSHLHMDHVAGFDAFFRRTFNRTHKPNAIWGPSETGQIMHHRFQGFLWNLSADLTGTWYVYDVAPETITCWRFEAHEAFALAHPCGRRPFNETIIDLPDFTVEAFHLEHLTPSLAYLVREKPRLNIDPAKLAALGLRPGPWLQQVKDRRLDAATTLEIQGARYELGRLRSALLVQSPGQSLAYLTDFVLNEAAQEQLVPALHGCTTMICESQYRHSDLALAQRTYHLTTTQAAQLARRAHVECLILFHLSDRYPRREWLEMLHEARAIFPNTHFPAHWHLTPNQE
jgi:ribonuclease Z